jgi:hypothetical protein
LVLECAGFFLLRVKGKRARGGGRKREGEVEFVDTLAFSIHPPPGHFANKGQKRYLIPAPLLPASQKLYH